MKNGDGPANEAPDLRGRDEEAHGGGLGPAVAAVAAGGLGLHHARVHAEHGVLRRAPLGAGRIGPADDDDALLRAGDDGLDLDSRARVRAELPEDTAVAEVEFIASSTVRYAF